MKILLGTQVVELEETIEGMRNALIENERKELLNIGCNGLDADEMAMEEFGFLSEEEILEKIKKLEIK